MSASKTERWLGPLFTELVSIPTGDAALARLIADAVGNAELQAAPIDWIRVGQSIRAELHWNDYPLVPPSYLGDEQGSQ